MMFISIDRKSNVLKCFVYLLFVSGIILFFYYFTEAVTLALKCAEKIRFYKPNDNVFFYIFSLKHFICFY